MFNSDVQKNEKKNNRKEINYTGVSIEEIAEGKYSNLLLLFDKFEKELDNALEFDVNINYVILEALELSIKNNTDEEIFEKYSNINSENFFRFLIDLDNTKKFISPEKINEKYLYPKALKKLNRFYNEYRDINDISIGEGYSTLYLFELIHKDTSPSVLTENLFKNLHNDDREKRHFVCKLINDYYNEVNNFSSEKTKEEYCYKMYKVDGQVENLLNQKLDNNETIESLYEKIK